MRRPILRGAVALLFATAVFAQETANSASVSGRVADPSGAAVPGALVDIRQIETNLSRSLETDGEGRFRFPYLRVGQYEITVRRDGFAPAARMLTLTVGSAFELPIGLTVAEERTEIVVTDEPTVLESARSQIVGTVLQSEVRSLPLNGRSFLDLALLVPGVSPTNTRSTQLFPETSAVPGQGISIGSQRNFSNSFLVDGLSANDDAAGLSGAFYGLDVIQEFQVVTSGGQAELGRALGGYVSVVTKSGTNSLHGDVYGYFRNQRLNAANPLSNDKLPLTQSQYGASLGGPLKQDRTFYFANFEQRRLNQSGLVTIAPANVAAVNARLTEVGYQGPLLTTGLYSNPVRTTNIFGKIDHQLTSNDQFSFRYSLYDSFAENSRGAGGLSAPSASSGLDNEDHTFAVSNVAVLSPRTVLETRGQFIHSDLKAEPTDPLGPAVSISGVATFGRLSSSPTGRENKMYEVVNNISHHAGTHAFRAGANFLYNDTNILFPRADHGRYTFSSLANFLNGVYTNTGFTQNFGIIERVQTNPNVGLYAQDEWKAHSRLTLNFGLRYELQFLETINTDTNNFSPRFGFAWTPFSSRRTIVRGGAGLFFDRIPLRALANALMAANNTTDLSQLQQPAITLAPAQTGAPVFPNVLDTALSSDALVSLSTMDRNMKNAFSQQASLEIEQQLGARSTVSIGFQHLRGLHLIANINQNVPTCVASGNNNGCRPNPNYANNSEYSSEADSNYNALHLAFVQRPADWGSFRVSYTYSKSLNNVGEFFFSGPINHYNIWEDYGRSDDDQRHRLVLQGSVQAPRLAGTGAFGRLIRGVELSGMLQYYSALPFNITTGGNTIQGTAARPTVNGAFIPRNAGEGFDFLNLSARLSRKFQLSERVGLQGLVEAFNALNRVNGVTNNGVFGSGSYPDNPSPQFGRITSVADPRSLQLGLRLSF